MDLPLGHRIAMLADQQHRVATRGDLLGLAVTRGQIRTRVRGGVLHPDFPGVYAVGTPALTPLQHTYAAARACGPEALVADASAAGLHDLSSWLPPTPRLLTSRAIRGPAGVRLRRTNSLPDEDRDEVRGIPVVTVTRLLLDTAAAGDAVRLRRWLRQARRLRTLDEAALWERIARGRPGGRLLATLLADEAHVPDEANDFEQAFAELVAAAGLPAPEREYALGPVRLDFAWPGLLLAAEADSVRDHAHAHGFESDRERDVAVFNLYRIVTLRFTSRRVIRTPAVVVGELVQAHAQAAEMAAGPLAAAARAKVVAHHRDPDLARREWQRARGV